MSEPWFQVLNANSRGCRGCGDVHEWLSIDCKPAAIPRCLLVEYEQYWPKTPLGVPWLKMADEGAVPVDPQHVCR